MLHINLLTFVAIVNGLIGMSTQEVNLEILRNITVHRNMVFLKSSTLNEHLEPGIHTNDHVIYTTTHTLQKPLLNANRLTKLLFIGFTF